MDILYVYNVYLNLLRSVDSFRFFFPSMFENKKIYIRHENRTWALE